MNSSWNAPLTKEETQREIDIAEKRLAKFRRQIAAEERWLEVLRGAA